MTDYMVIGRYRNRENTQRLVKAIRAKGFTCYDFAEKSAYPDTPDASAEDQMRSLESHANFLDDPIHEDHFNKDLAGLENAKTVIMLLPAGNSAHIEAGIAFGQKKKVILIGVPEKPESLYYIFDEYYKTQEDFLKTI